MERSLASRLALVASGPVSVSTLVLGSRLRDLIEVLGPAAEALFVLRLATQAGDNQKERVGPQGAPEPKPKAESTLIVGHP